MTNPPNRQAAADVLTEVVAQFKAMHGPFDHDYIKDEKCCARCKLMKRADDALATLRAGGEPVGYYCGGVTGTVYATANENYRGPPIDYGAPLYAAPSPSVAPVSEPLTVIASMCPEDVGKVVPDPSPAEQPKPATYKDFVRLATDPNRKPAEQGAREDDLPFAPAGASASWPSSPTCAAASATEVATPHHALAVLSAFVAAAPNQVCCGCGRGGGMDDSGNGEPPECCGEPLDRRDADAAIAFLAAPPVDASEAKLTDAGVFKGAHGLRGLLNARDFWDRQPYGTRLYYGNGGADYLHIGVLRAAVELLDKPAAPPLATGRVGATEAQIERAAKSMCDAIHGEGAWETCMDRHRDAFRRDARNCAESLAGPVVAGEVDLHPAQKALRRIRSVANEDGTRRTHGSSFVSGMLRAANLLDEAINRPLVYADPAKGA